MRPVAALALALAVAGCDADIASGTYFCGEERACPPDLACDGATAVCVFPERVEAFSCGEDGNLNEPDDTLLAPFDLGTGGCGTAAIARAGCIDTADDLDHLAMTTPGSCAEPVRVLVQYPVAYAPLAVELLDDTGAVVATGEVTNDLDEAGRARIEIVEEASPDQALIIRVTLGEGGDCGGDCAHNRYSLSVL